MISVWPAIIWIMLTVFGTTAQLVKGELGTTGFIATVGGYSLLYWGGFFDALISRIG